MSGDYSIAKHERPPTGGNGALELLQQIVDTLARMERNQDDFYRVFLNARFPYGKPDDKWRRSA